VKQYPSIKAFKNQVPTVFTAGTFDGVHIGHKKLLNQLTTVAKQEQLESVVLTFFPHPRMVLQSDTDLKLINTIDERIALLSKTGIEHLIVHPFSKEFSRITAAEYVRDILVEKFHIKKIIVGYDHHFGRNRNATTKDLIAFGKTFGFDVIEISAQQSNDIAVSSTKIRNALQTGDIATANLFLGYPFMLTGEVVEGKKMGTKIGYPTANLYIKETYKLIPKEGVYVVQSIINNKTVYGITNIGTNPTVGGTQKTIETHFLDFEEMLYKKPLQIALLSRIRDEEKFDSIKKLQEAIKKDENFARDFIANYTKSNFL
jgi:riboflavin kinase/FMN adenylyltransferase